MAPKTLVVGLRTKAVSLPREPREFHALAVVSVPFLASPLLQREGFRHAFFTRQGGASEGAYGSLNFSATTGDSPENVAENLRRAALALEVDAERLFFLSQVHGVLVREVSPSDNAAALRKVEGDAVLCRQGHVGCAVRSADCVPVLLADRRSGAVVAVHAGWKGTERGVVREAVQALVRDVGSRSALIAAIGPHISVKCFEVSPEVASQLVTASPDPDVVEMGPRGKPHVNLRRIVEAQLVALGVPEEAVDHIDGCTMSEPDRYFSYRRDGARSGRLLSAIVAREV